RFVSSVQRLASSVPEVPNGKGGQFGAGSPRAARGIPRARGRGNAHARSPDLPFGTISRTPQSAKPSQSVLPRCRSPAPLYQTLEPVVRLRLLCFFGLRRVSWDSNVYARCYRIVGE